MTRPIRVIRVLFRPVNVRSVPGDDAVGTVHHDIAGPNVCCLGEFVSLLYVSPTPISRIRSRCVVIVERKVGNCPTAIDGRASRETLGCSRMSVERLVPLFLSQTINVPRSVLQTPNSLTVVLILPGGSALGLIDNACKSVFIVLIPFTSGFWFLNVKRTRMFQNHEPKLRAPSSLPLAVGSAW